MLLDETRFGEVMSGFRRHAFRLETLDAYDVGEDDEVARYLRGELTPDPEDHEPWLATLRAARAAGKVQQRVHVMRSPLSGYLRYECEWGYLLNTAAGEDVRILDLAERPCPAGLDVDHDFWLFDDSDVLRMHYDAGGRFLGAEVLGEEMLPRYLAARDAALGAAESFASYWRRHPEYHQASQRPTGGPSRQRWLRRGACCRRACALTDHRDRAGGVPSRQSPGPRSAPSRRLSPSCALRWGELARRKEFLLDLAATRWSGPMQGRAQVCGSPAARLAKRRAECGGLVDE